MGSKWVKVANCGEIAPGGMKVVEIDGIPLAICNVEGTYYAVQDECTHETYPLTEGTLEGHVLTCVLHGAQFDVRTGKVLQPPAYEPVRTYQIAVNGEEIFVVL
ncbi:MAG: non-heme iron oxygenase ferredoxin subunit [Gemmatimonadota bacterium]|nr:MAG: non-heme iron oxygenase ferredoxin subunit [Gemmatimonadota bacterium]